MHKKYPFALNLQVFAEGGATGAEGAAAGPNGSGEAASASGGGVADRLTFDQLLEANPDYREAHGKLVEKAIHGRFKTAKQAEERAAQMEPLLEMLAGKYGIKPGADGRYDVAALTQAAESDDSYWENEAAALGMSVEALRGQKKLQRENNLLRQQQEKTLEQQREQAFFAGLHKQAEELKKTVPGFNIGEAMKNKDFCRMVQVGVPVKAAYFAMNHEGMMSGAVEQATRQAMSAAAQTVQAGANRPQENGAGAGAAVNTTAANFRDPAYRADLKRRVNRGERVVLP